MKDLLAELPEEARRLPQLVAQIGFEEWTGDGQLRQPRFQGLREDKNPRQVVREVARG